MSTLQQIEKKTSERLINASEAGGNIGLDTLKSVLGQSVFKPTFDNPREAGIDIIDFGGGFIADSGAHTDPESIKNLVPLADAFVQLAMASDNVSMASLLVGPKEEFVQAVVNDNTDTIWFMLPDDVPGSDTGHNYVAVTIEWQGKVRLVDKMIIGSGESSKDNLEKVLSRLNDTNTRIDSLVFSFVSTNRKN